MNKVTADLLLEAKRQIESEGWRGRSYSLPIVHWLRVKDHPEADHDGPDSQKWFVGLPVHLSSVQALFCYDGVSGAGQNFIDLQTGERF